MENSAIKPTGKHSRLGLGRSSRLSLSTTLAEYTSTRLALAQPVKSKQSRKNGGQELFVVKGFTTALEGKTN